MRGIRFCSVVLAAVAAFGVAACGETKPSSPPADETAFVSVTEIDSTIVVDARYFGEHNFIGGRINGYEAPKCLLTKEAGAALAEVQRELRPMGLGVKTYDCFDPLAHTANPAPSGNQRALRELLANLMDEHGFKNLAEEWWHFTLKDEPFPNTYFDFPIQ